MAPARRISKLATAPPSEKYTTSPPATKSTRSRKGPQPKITKANSASESLALQNITTSTKAKAKGSGEAIPAKEKKTTPLPPSRTSSRLQEKTLSPLKSTEETEPAAKRSRSSLQIKSAPKSKSLTYTKLALKTRATPKTPPKLTSIPIEHLDVFACGTGEYGELGLGPQPNAKIVKRPRLNGLLSIDTVGIVAIAYGGMHGVALSYDGNVYTWGVNDLGALGRVTKAKDDKLKDADADSSDSEDEEDVPLNEDESTPKLVEFPCGTVITRIAAGDSITVVVTDTGLVYGWGTFRSNDGVLGFSTNSRIQHTPTLIKELKGIVDVCCGNDHALALDIKGKAWAWGNGQQNQLGRRVVERTRIQGLIPREVGIPRKKIKSIHSGSFHSFAVTIDGLVYSWGLNSFAQCGIYQEAKDESTTLIVPIPTCVSTLKNFEIVQLDGGDRHSIALTSDGDLLAWGRMDAHQVGIGLANLPQEDVILDVSGKPRCLIAPHKISETAFSSIASGSNHNIAISREDGAAYSWGFGDLFQCGQGNPGADVPVPTKIENTATQGVSMTSAACGGQVTILAGTRSQKINGSPMMNVSG
ncbi:regulator of chromosome condensation 1/beta-lactamase-inhibitor protein II [Trichophaea hybrida]|nr:regulator of chromosome condensation 1/beta-lactamase-inhibitor protein II [Trichophaea hybrida]